MRSENIQLPIIHLNGSSLKTLRESYDAAAEAFEDFLDAWGGIECNARDYYPEGPEAWDRAHDMRCAIASSLREVEVYLNAHREHLYSFDR